MKVTIYPSAPSGSIGAPPSKSAAHRMLICAGLARGSGRVEGVAPSQDVMATLDCLAALGAQTEYDGAAALIRGTDPASARSAVLNCRESGSTLRFFIPLCLLSENKMRLDGSASLLKRPLSVYEQLCRQRGLLFEKSDKSVWVQGRLSAGEYELDGGVSSQFISGLMFALPLTEGDSLLRLRPPVESRAYIDMTADALRRCGIKVGWHGGTEVEIPGGQTYLPREMKVEGDWSNAAFFLAMGVPVTGLDENSCQGDRVCVEYFRALDAGRAELDLSECPDLGPVMFAYAAMRNGGVFTGTRRLRIKESDRGAAMKEELEKFGADVSIGEDTISVGCGITPPDSTLDGHNDHRIVMALSVLCARTGGTIAGAEAVNKSFPDFFGRLREAGIELKEE